MFAAVKGVGNATKAPASQDKSFKTREAKGARKALRTRARKNGSRAKSGPKVSTGEKTDAPPVSGRNLESAEGAGHSVEATKQGRERRNPTKLVEM
jgi:hypothetical protein